MRCSKVCGLEGHRLEAARNCVPGLHKTESRKPIPPILVRHGHAAFRRPHASPGKAGGAKSAERPFCLFSPQTLRLSFALCLALAAGVARADTLTYDFTYMGYGTFTGQPDFGSGSLSYTYSPGDYSGTLSAFSFTDTLHSGSNASTYSYDLGDVPAPALVLLPSGQLGLAVLYTVYKVGTDPSFGPVYFDLDIPLAFGGPLNGLTAGSDVSALNYFATISAGDGTITEVGAAVTPEPGTLGLLITGMVGTVLIMRRKSAEQVL